MKYNFVYDTDFLEKSSLYLSKEEMDIVFATVIGKHNAIFYGYKPERLVNAIKFLSHSENFVEQKLFSDIETGLKNATEGIMYLKDFDVWKFAEQQFLYSHTLNVSSRCTQFIAITSINPSDVVVPDIISNFDIIYMCKEDYKPPISKERLASKFSEIFEYHNSLHSGHFITSTELELENYWTVTEAYLYLRKLWKSNPIIGRKVSMVSRSVSDCNYNSMTTLEDIHVAEAMCRVQHTPSEELPF